jgi:hypothetical protein
VAELIEGKRPIQVSFLTSLPLNLLLTMALVPSVDRFEGLDAWLREARSSLPADLRRELALLTGFPGRHLRFVEAIVERLLRTETQAQASFATFHSQLKGLSPGDYQELALQALRRGAPEGAVDPAELLPDRQQVAAYLASRTLHVDGMEAAALIVDPEGLKRRFLSAVVGFWQNCYRPVYQECRPVMERSVAYHRRQSYSPHFDELFLSITGRILPQEVQFRLDEIREVCFVPACHLGPYVALLRNSDRLVVYYNCRSSLLGERKSGELVGHLYPLLKALADETRLQILLLLRGREMYAQEIVEQLGLSQPAISRHLNLMVTAGLLEVRPEGGAKYYAPDHEVWQQLLEELGGLL